MACMLISMEFGVTEENAKCKSCWYMSALESFLGVHLCSTVVFAGQWLLSVIQVSVLHWKYEV